MIQNGVAQVSMLEPKCNKDTEQNGARCRSVVEHLLMVHWVVRLILHGGPTELFLIPAIDPRLV